MFPSAIIVSEHHFGVYVSGKEMKNTDGKQ